MKYTKKQFLKDVAAEARALKKNTSKNEINRLDLKTINPRSTYRCIYGQITGGCRSVRAVKLITTCCKRFIKQGNGYIPDTLQKLQKYVNGKKSEAPWSVIYLSTIETYTAMPWAKNENLIAYLKGEKKTLVL